MARPWRTYTAETPGRRNRNRLTGPGLSAAWSRAMRGPRNRNLSMTAWVVIACIVLAEVAAAGYVIGNSGRVSQAEVAAVESQLFDQAFNAAYRASALEAGTKGRQEGERVGRRAGTRAGTRAAAAAVAEKQARLAAAAASKAAAAAPSAEDPGAQAEAPVLPEPVTTPAPASPPPKPCFDAQGFPC